MNSDQILELLKHAADEAILPRWKELADGEVTRTEHGDLVTVADTEAEKIISRELRAAFPDAVILGEEATATDPSLMTRFHTAEHSFTVDPVDGTANFVNGSQDFAVMVAEIKRGETIRSWILQPGHAVAFVAEKGAGAYRNSTRMKTRTISDDPASWRGVTSRKALRKESFKPLARLGSAWWCCGVDYPNVALGRADYIVYKHTYPWDHAPGGLILSEVGGRSIRRTGTAYSPSDPMERWLIAGRGDIPRRVLPYLKHSLANKAKNPGSGTEPEDLLDL